MLTAFLTIILSLTIGIVMLHFKLPPFVKFRVRQRYEHDSVLESALVLTDDWRTEDILYPLTYNPETQIYQAGCFTGTRDQLAARLNNKKRHKLAREFYLNEIARVHSQYPDA